MTDEYRKPHREPHAMNDRRYCSEATQHNPPAAHRPNTLRYVDDHTAAPVPAHYQTTLDLGPVLPAPPPAWDAQEAEAVRRYKEQRKRRKAARLLKRKRAKRANLHARTGKKRP